jgi:hypothetical protein
MAGSASVLALPAGRRPLAWQAVTVPSGCTSTALDHRPAGGVRLLPGAGRVCTVTEIIRGLLALRYGWWHRIRLLPLSTWCRLRRPAWSARDDSSQAASMIICAVAGGRELGGCGLSRGSQADNPCRGCRIDPGPGEAGCSRQSWRRAGRPEDQPEGARPEPADAGQSTSGRQAPQRSGPRQVQGPEAPACRGQVIGRRGLAWPLSRLAASGSGVVRMPGPS